MKIHPVGAALFHADRRTGMTNVTDSFPSFANVPKESRTKKFNDGSSLRQAKYVAVYLISKASLGGIN